MTAITVLIILDTILQLLFCKFTLWFLICLICRVIFCMRNFGIIFKTRPIYVGECVALGCMAIWYFMFHKNGVPWIGILLTFLFIGIAVLLEWLDGVLYVYEVIDEEDL